jgi:protein TonB
MADESVMAYFPKKREMPKPPPKPRAEIFVLVEELQSMEENLFFPELDPLLPEIHEIGFETEIVGEDSLYITAEEMPEFPGGLEALYKYLQNNIQFPQQAKDAGVAGKVHLAFIVGKQGQITQVEVLSGIGWGLDEEAVRVVNGMPLWKPGKQRGIPVNVRYNLPIKYTLAP